MVRGKGREDSSSSVVGEDGFCWNWWRVWYSGGMGCCCWGGAGGGLFVLLSSLLASSLVMVAGSSNCGSWMVVGGGVGGTVAAVALPSEVIGGIPTVVVVVFVFVGVVVEEEGSGLKLSLFRFIWWEEVSGDVEGTSRADRLVSMMLLLVIECTVRSGEDDDGVSSPSSAVVLLVGCLVSSDFVKAVSSSFEPLTSSLSSLSSLSSRDTNGVINWDRRRRRNVRLRPLPSTSTPLSGSLVLGWEVFSMIRYS